MATVTAQYWIKHYTPRLGETVLDVGAGDGADLDAFDSLVGPSGLVLAIEAHPELYRLASEAARGRQSIRCIHAACVEYPGVPAWIDSSDPWEGRTTTLESSATHTISVPARTLDEIVREHQISYVHLLKMNIEGAEVAALRGASECLARTRHAVISAHDFRADWGESERFRTQEQVIALLIAAGFKIVEVSGQWRHIYAKHYPAVP